MNTQRSLIVLCLLHKSLLGLFDAVPGDQLWSMVAMLGKTNQAIKGYATPISNADLPITITTPGRYAVVEPLTYTPGIAAITIASDNVHLTLNDYALTLNNNAAPAILVNSNLSNVMITNGSCIGGNGIVVQDNASYLRIENITFLNAGAAGLYALTIGNNNSDVIIRGIKQDGNSTTNGITVGSTTHLSIEQCSLSNNQNSGILVTSSEDVSIHNCAASGGGAYGIGLNDCTNTTIRSCAISLVNSPSQAGVWVFDSVYVQLIDISALSCSTGIIIDSSEQISCKNGTISNCVQGFVVEGNATASSDITLIGYNIQEIDTDGIVIVDGTNNVTIQKVAVSNTGANGMNIGTTGSMSIGSTNNLIIKDCTVDGTPATFSAIKCNQLQNVVCKRNILEETTNPFAFFTVLGTIQNGCIKQNSFLCSGFLVNAGFYFEQPISNLYCGENSIELNNLSTGITSLQGTTNCVFNNCTITNCGIGFSLPVNMTFSAISYCTITGVGQNGISFSGTKNAVTHNLITAYNLSDNGSSAIAYVGNRNYIGFNSLIAQGNGANTSGAYGITETASGGYNAMFGNLIQDYTVGSGGILGTSWYPQSIFYCDTISSGTATPTSHWYNLHMKYT